MEPSIIRGMRSEAAAILYVIVFHLAVHVMVFARNMQLALFRSIFDPAGLRLHGALRRGKQAAIPNPMSVLLLIA